MTGSMHRGGRGHVWGVCMAGGMCGRGVCVVGGKACAAGEMATAADGTHPTGMHSCYFSDHLNSASQCRIFHN